MKNTSRNLIFASRRSGVRSPSAPLSATCCRCIRAIPQNMQTLFSEKRQRNRTILTTCQSDSLYLQPAGGQDGETFCKVSSSVEIYTARLPDNRSRIFPRKPTSTPNDRQCHLRISPSDPSNLIPITPRSDTQPRRGAGLRRLLFRRRRRRLTRGRATG